MKKIVIHLFLLMASLHSYGQQDFAPPTASWYNDMPYGVFHTYAAGDTVILGRTARKVKRQAITIAPWTTTGPMVSSLSQRLIYSTPDTVFVYNEVFADFTPLYVFNVQAGDTVCLPMFTGEPGMNPSQPPNFNDSTFCYRVDSVVMKQYDTAWLKTVYTSAIDDGGVVFAFGCMNCPDSVQAYAERIGSLKTGLLPNCITCTFPLSESIQSPGALRCYSDTGYSIKLVADECDKSIINKVEEYSSGYSEIRIQPIPADNKIEVLAASEIANIIIYSQDGRVVTKKAAVRNDRCEIDVSELAPAMYLLSYELKSGARGTKKVLVR